MPVPLINSRVGALRLVLSRTALVLWTSLAISPSAHAVAKSQSLAELEHTMLRSREGVPASIHDMVQTPDGFLWVGGGAGLFQYDGVQFRRYRTPDGGELPDSYVVALAATPDGGLWVVSLFRDVYFIKDGTLTAYGAAQGVPPYTPCGVTVDAAGHAWLGSPDGAFRLDGGHWVSVPMVDGSPARAHASNCIRADAAGNVWVAGDKHVLVLARGSERFRAMRRTIGDSEGLVLDVAGDAWLGDSGGFFALADDRRGVRRSVLEQLSGGTPQQTFIGLLDRSGMAWGLVGGRYLRMPASGLTTPPSPPASAPAVERLSNDEAGRGLMDHQNISWLEDAEGDVWAASNLGLDRFRSLKFRQARLAGTPSSMATIAVSPTGTLWVAQASGLFRRDPGQDFVSLHGAGDVARCGDCWMLPMGDGQLYLVNDGLHRLTASGFQAEKPDFGAAEADVHGLAEDDRHRLWASVLRVRGVFLRQDGRWIRRDGRDGLPSGAAMSLTAGTQGRMWLGYPGNVIAVVEDHEARVFKAAQGVDVGTVLAMLPQGDKAWIGGSHGLDYFDGQRAHAVANVRGLALTNLSGLVMTPTGELWLNDDAGVQRIPAAELAAVARDPSHRIDGEFFDADDGIEGSTVGISSLPTAVRSGDGLLWFRRTEGLYWIDPAHVARNAVAPRAFVMGVRANGVDHFAPPFRLAPGTSSIQVDYTAPLLSAPDRARFRYRLHGVDSGWQDAGNRRQAFYTNLAPGTYQFDVQAANEDGAWSAVPASVPITVAPAYWQTNWFRGLLILVVALPLWAAASAWLRLRMRRLERGLRIEARIKQDERGRIARDLHDTLLQNMHALVWRFDAVASQLSSEGHDRPDLTEALRRAEEALHTGRDSIMAAPEAPADDRALVDQLRGIGDEWSCSTGVAFEMRVDTPRRDILPAAGAPMRGVLAEALANAFRHAEASRVTLRVRFDRHVLTGEVLDDGKGMVLADFESNERLSNGHMGLNNMRDRARMVGAQLDIESSPGHGTRVRIRLPARRAYRRQGWRALFGRRPAPDMPAA